MKQENIRNFAIIAHIDHGKSTLSDRLLEVTNTVTKREMKEQLLDQMDLERERGITIKLQPVRMKYEGHVLNLIDTPGHVDFSYEVSRSLAACEGVLLVVDSTQGIQAQTLANVYAALEHDLTIIPVVNKIDLPNAMPDQVAEELETVLGFDKDEIIFVSAKTGENIDELLKDIIKRIPAPKGNPDENLRCLIFDSSYDKHRGVVAYIRIVDGEIKKNDEIKLLGSSKKSTTLDVGYFRPKLTTSQGLKTGEVGFIVTGLRDVRSARVGDTITHLKDFEKTEALPGYKEIKPMVYADIFPMNADDYPELRDAMDKLSLNDASLTFDPEHIPSLGHGFRVGFLGLLHMDIVQERLSREFNIDVIATAPSVAYKVNLDDGQTVSIKSAAEMPDPSKVESIEEPWVETNIVIPNEHIGGIMELVTSRRGTLGDTEYLGANRVNIQAEMPLAEVIVDFYDKLKTVTSGYASLNYIFKDYRIGDLVKLDVLVAGEAVEALSSITHVENSESYGRDLAQKLKDLIPRQQFDVPIQAAVGGKIIARETIKAYRKDVTQKLYGGDVTRKRKLLEKQKQGKKRMKRVGQVDIPQEAFFAVLKK